MNVEAAPRLSFPGMRARDDRPPYAVRLAITALAILVAAGSGFALWRRTTTFVSGQRGASLYNSGQPGSAYPFLSQAVNGTRLHSRPCIDLGDMAVWAIDDGVFQHVYRIDDAWTLARLAFVSYAEALDREPGSAKAWAGLAELFKKVRVLRIKEGGLDLDRIEEEVGGVLEEEDELVIEAYRRAIRFEPNNYFYHAYLGDFYDGRGFRREAVESYTRAVEIMPDLSWHYYLAEGPLPEDLYAAIRSGLEKAIETNKDFPRDRIWQNIGILAERQGDLSGAEGNYRRAADTSRDPAPYLRMLGTLYFNEKRYADAESMLTRALQGNITPQMQAHARALLGRCMVLRGDLRGAVDQFQQARWVYPAAGYVTIDLARAYENLGMFDKAESEYHAAIRSDPGRASAYAALIEMYRRTRQISKAIPLARRLVEMFPEDQVFKEQLRSLNSELGRPETG